MVKRKFLHWIHTQFIEFNQKYDIEQFLKSVDISPSYDKKCNFFLRHSVYIGLSLLLTSTLSTTINNLKQKSLLQI